MDTHQVAVFSWEGVTNSAGWLSCRYKLVFDAQMGTYSVAAQATSPGYANKTVQTSFFSIG
jgi:hypothetical protein